MNTDREVSTEAGPSLDGDSRQMLAKLRIFWIEVGDYDLDSGKEKKTMDLVQKIASKVNAQVKSVKVPNFKSGDTVNVYVKVKEGEKERVQLYRGVVTKIQGAGASRSFTVRKVSAGVGVERSFPFASPALDKVELISQGQVRRSRLFYLRKLEGKAANINSELVSGSEASSQATAPAKA